MPVFLQFNSNIARKVLPNTVAFAEGVALVGCIAFTLLFSSSQASFLRFQSGDVCMCIPLFEAYHLILSFWKKIHVLLEYSPFSSHQWYWWILGNVVLWAAYHTSCWHWNISSDSVVALGLPNIFLHVLQFPNTFWWCRKLY